MRVLLHLSVKGKLANLKGLVISSSISGLYVSVFLFAVLFAEYFLLFTDQTTQHNISTKCQGYTTDLIACHWHHTSLCILVIQSNTVPNVNRRGKKKKNGKKKNQTNSSVRERWSWEEKKILFFIEKEWLLFYL